MSTSPAKASAHAAVEQELFNIFTFYTLHGSAKDPERMTATQFKNFARDVQLPSTVLRADLDVLFRRVLSEKHAVHATMSPSRQSALWRAHSALTHTNAAAAPPARVAAHTSQRKFDFADFVNALMHLAVRAFPSMTQMGAAFQQLLMQHVLPLASRRSPADVSMPMADPALRDVRRMYDESMREIFEFYLQKGTLRRLDSTARHTASLSVGVATNIANARGRGRGTGDGRTMSHENEKYRHGMLPDAAIDDDGREVEEEDHLLCYPEVLKLAADFKFDAFVSSLDLGDAFLSAVSLQQQREQQKEEWERWKRQSERLASPGSPASPKAAVASPVTPGGSVLAVGTGPGGVPLPAALGLHFDAFWEFLLRVALMAFGSATFQAAAAAVDQQTRPGSGNHLAEHRQPPSPADSVLGLFLHMWRSVHDTPPTRDARQLSGYLNTVIIGTRLFNRTFFEQWKRDQFRDYVGGYRPDQGSILRYGTRGRRRSRTRAAQPSPPTPSSSRSGARNPHAVSSAPPAVVRSPVHSAADARAARALAASLFGLTPAAGEAGGDGAQKLSISPALQDLLRQQPEVRRLLLEGLNAAALGDGAGASGRKR